MYIENFESFIQQAEDLYTANPLRTRYTFKYRHCDGKLVLKVTDDTTVRQSLALNGLSEFKASRFRRLTCYSLPSYMQCLKYKTGQQSDLKRLERLNTLFFSLMATGQRPGELVTNSYLSLALQLPHPNQLHSAIFDTHCEHLPLVVAFIFLADDVAMRPAEQPATKGRRKG